MPTISFDAIHEMNGSAWALDINGTQLPVNYRIAHPTYRNTSIPGEAAQALARHALPLTRRSVSEGLHRVRAIVGRTSCTDVFVGAAAVVKPCGRSYQANGPHTTHRACAMQAT